MRESYFFRERAELERTLSELIAARRAQRRLSLWSAGCAAGEEPYTLAMLLDGLLPDREAWQISILATDVDAAALETARRGTYGEWALRETPEWARGLHFERHGRREFELSRTIRAAVTFGSLNLAADDFPGSLDMIVCRNVLMYFTEAARERTVRRLRAALAPGGRLLLSPLDAPPVPAAPEPRRPAPRPPRPAPAPRVDTLVRARTAADRGQLHSARGLCLEALRERPLDAGAHLLLAAVEEERGDLEAAIWALRRAVYTAPNAPAAHFRLGGLLLRTGAAEAGRRSLATAATLLHDEAPDALVDGLTAGEVLAAARAAS